MTVQEFANKIRVKYPGAYANVDDLTLAQKIVEKYPQYASQVDTRMTPQQIEAQDLPLQEAPLLGEANMMAQQGLQGLGVGAANVITGKPGQAPERASQAVQESLTTPTWPEKIGSTVAGGYSPSNIMLGAGMAPLVKAIAPKVGGALAGLFRGRKAVQAGENIVAEPFKTNLLMPKTAIKTAAEARTAFTGAANPIDPKPLITAVGKLLENTTEISGAQTPLNTVLNDIMNAAKETGTISVAQAQQIVSDLGSKAAYEAATRTPAKGLVKAAHGALQNVLQKQVPGLAEKTAALAGAEQAKPFMPLVETNYLRGLGGAGALTQTAHPVAQIAGALELSPRLTGLSLQGLGVGKKILSNPKVNPITINALRNVLRRQQ